MQINKNDEVCLTDALPLKLEYTPLKIYKNGKRFVKNKLKKNK